MWFRKSAPSFATLPFDGIRWRWEAGPRVVAIGDVHGDLRALGAILHERQVIDDAGNWIGRNAILVLLGDLIGGHAQSRLVLDFVLRLEGEARRAGGEVQTLIGNHDLLVFAHKTGKATRAERALYKEYPIAGLKKPSWKHAFDAATPYGKWLGTRNTIAQIGDTIFCHAGIDGWGLGLDPGAVNATVRAWIGYWQGQAEKPPAATRWTVGEAGMSRYAPLAVGPIWTRGFRADSDGQPRGGPTRETLEAVLHQLQGRRLVVGHAPTPFRTAVLQHPYYGDRVAMIDTGLYREDGNPCALELRGGAPTIHYCARPTDEREWERRQWRDLKAGGAALSWMPRWWK